MEKKITKFLSTDTHSEEIEFLRQFKDDVLHCALQKCVEHIQGKITKWERDNIVNAMLSAHCIAYMKLVNLV